MSGSQRTSSIYAREALIEIDYGDLCEDLKVRINRGSGEHLPSCLERMGQPILEPFENMTGKERAGKRGELSYEPRSLPHMYQ